MSRDLIGFQSTHPNAPASGFSGSELMLSLVYPHELSGQSIPLSSGLTLGRAPEADVTSIFHPTISRRHAEIRLGLGGLLCLSDLASRNGTFVDGRRVQLPVPIGAQSVVRLGDVLAVVDGRSQGRFDDDPVLPGTGARIQQIRSELARAALDPAPVLIIGETGTGKERLAREVHERSGRKGPYLAVSCAELPSLLVESELFGHERGAFTGASSAKPGLFQAARAGTLFLDEIGELPIELQTKLLRVLQEREVRPVGGTKAVPVDVRVVAATNRDLPELVAREEFRRDLYARLALWELRLPPLRERRQDILSWVSRLLSSWNRERGIQSELGLQPDAAERVLLHDWRDNLRGLNRLVHRLGSLGSARPFSLRALVDALPELATAAELPAPPQALPSAEHSSTLPPHGSGSNAPTAPGERPNREEFLALYEASGCSVRAMSKHFGKDRRQIYRWLEAFGIARES